MVLNPYISSLEWTVEMFWYLSVQLFPRNALADNAHVLLSKQQTSPIVPITLPAELHASVYLSSKCKACSLLQNRLTPKAKVLHTMNKGSFRKNNRGQWQANSYVNNRNKQAKINHPETILWKKVPNVSGSYSGLHQVKPCTTKPRPHTQVNRASKEVLFMHLDVPHETRQHHDTGQHHKTCQPFHREEKDYVYFYR